MNQIEVNGDNETSDEEDDELSIDDPRICFFHDVIVTSFKIREIKWIEMFEKKKEKFEEFFEDTKLLMLVFTSKPNGDVTITSHFISNHQTAVYFVRNQPELIDRVNFRSILTYGSLLPAAFDQFAFYVQEVIVSLLDNRNNQSTWPTVVADDVINHVSRLTSRVVTSKGLIKGSTVLALPIATETTNERSPRHVIHAIESSVIDWSQQVRSVIRQLPSDEDFPWPKVELRFWKSRFNDLGFIRDQLRGKELQKFAEILKVSGSSYSTALEQLIENVEDAFLEAYDINLHLKSFEKQFSLMEEFGNFPKLKPVLCSIMRILELIWMNSNYYKKAKRMTSLLQQIANQLIDQAMMYLLPEEIFKSEAEESLEKLENVQKIFFYFRSIFDRSRNKINEAKRSDDVTADDVNQIWDFPSDLVFGRVKKFCERIEQLKNIFQSFLDLEKLEKLEFNGMNSFVLGESLKLIHENFMTSFKIFQDSSYNCLDLKCQEFVDDFKDFDEMMKEVDLSLCDVIKKAFESCSGLEGMFKLLAIIGPLRNRKVICEKTLFLFHQILIEFDQELKSCQMRFEEYLHGVDENWNLPKTSASLLRIQQLQKRIQSLRNQFRFYKKISVFNSKKAEKIFSKFKQMKKKLKKCEKKVFEKWEKSVGKICEFDLNQSLLKRDEEKILVNISSKLIELLCDVKYLIFFGKRDLLPSCALMVFEKRDLLWKVNTNLQMICLMYNKMKTNLNKIELQLVCQQIQQIDLKLESTVNGELTWNNHNSWSYIKDLRNLVEDLQIKTEKTKENVEKINLILEKWREKPIFERRDEKKDLFFHFEDREVKMKKMFTRIQEDSEIIKELVQILFLKRGLYKLLHLQINCDLFGCDPNDNDWNNYLDYIDDFVLKGFSECVENSLEYFQKNTNLLACKDPFLKIEIFLEDRYLFFDPSLEDEDENLIKLIQLSLDSIFQIGAQMRRISRRKKKDYFEDMQMNSHLVDIKAKILEQFQEAILKTQSHKSSFDKYSYLWNEDRSEFMKQFLLYNHMLTTEEIEDHSDAKIPENPPTLEQFQNQIDNYEDLYLEVEKIDDLKIISSWLCVDMKPFRQNLLIIIKKWSFIFKQHLLDHVINSLNELEQFIEDTNHRLEDDVISGDYESLIEVMGRLIAIKERQQVTDEMFAPLQNTIDVITSYDQKIPEMTYKQLEELPERWQNIKKRAIIVRQNVAPLQAIEAASIRKRGITFEKKLIEFRERFRSKAPFLYISSQPYFQIDQMQLETQNLQNEFEQLKTSAELFEVGVPDSKLLKIFRKDLQTLKHLWDLILVVRTSIDDWTLTKWRQIRVDKMDSDLRQFLRDVRKIDKDSRSWDVYRGIEAELLNMMTSLRSIVELQNPSIRERHWIDLMKETGVEFEMNSETNLSDLLALQLHLVEDEVRTIVEKAEKEFGIEKILEEIKEVWKNVKIEFESHVTSSAMTSNIKLLIIDSTLIDLLEENQVQLQNISTSKFVGYFRDEIVSWQMTLHHAEHVINLWLEVQGSWKHLENVFISSKDIRSELPVETEQFEEINSDFQRFMKESENISNLIISTKRDKIIERLSDLIQRLAICEKVLTNYLERKRLLFPRFYFVSSADLLDILSKGNRPPEITRHLRKLFDNINNLLFDRDQSDDVIIDQVTGMFSCEEEFVKFKETCNLKGQVEVWLNKLENCQQENIRRLIHEAVVSYEEKPRDKWLLDFPAQAALTASQIWWSTEVKMAFDKLEEGFENAMKEYNRKQIIQLNQLISNLLQDIPRLHRQSIMTMCTLDVHNRDVIAKLISEKSMTSSSFTWLSQLRHRWDDVTNECWVDICDAKFCYQNEYLGNTPRLVITPLTDRCYITLTQSLHLTMSGAPSGPAGTGKTETTKDLGRAIALPVYVFNCSEQMNFRSIGNIFKGLSQTGAWGCFDEFNRIAVEVLSVVAIQVKMIHDALRGKKRKFQFMDDVITLSSSVGIFITMNPGYAGRTELPENLKSLFRPCAMVVPDTAQICEIMLVAEGFMDAKMLARKFITLYDLCKELCSKKNHYDWGLRAVKSVLVVAGSLRRSDPQIPEEQVLMRALRDFNLPKISSEDLPVFMGLISDLFPNLQVARKRDADFEEQIKDTILKLKLQPEENLILKVVQLEELLNVRHSVFVIGQAGTGKSQILKVLHQTHQISQKKSILNYLNPKVLTTDQLFGFIHHSTQEWKDGLFSSLMRSQSNLLHSDPKWILLDGDIDPMWIESLNTVMDDNKMLTLASNERIPLTDSMKLLFEISHLKSATPATVSRAGILFVNQQDLSWNPPVTTWIEKRSVQTERANLTVLFDKYIPTCLEVLKTNFKMITPVSEISLIQTLCCLLECLLTPENVPGESPREVYEMYFVFAAVWAFGGPLLQDQLTDHKAEFSNWWIKEFKQIKFPSTGSVFDFCIDPKTRKFVPWGDDVTQVAIDSNLPVHMMMVDTIETRKIKYFFNLLVTRQHPVMLVGSAGVGKTLLVENVLSHLQNDEYLLAKVPFNFYTTSEILQNQLEKHLEKKVGRKYGPIGNKQLIYFLDDLNMSEVDTYGTVQPHTLIRQHFDYNHWYDRNKLSLKEIGNTQYVACMNPTAGSFKINPRLQRHFSVFAMNFPDSETLSVIYSNIFSSYLNDLTGHNFSNGVKKSCDLIIKLSIDLHQHVSSLFLPTAIKFHYLFNLRDLSRVFQGLLFATPECLKTNHDVIRLWIHESRRVYSDKMVVDEDVLKFNQILVDTLKRVYEVEDSIYDKLLEEPNIFSHFSKGISELRYLPVDETSSLTEILKEVLENYNESFPAMDLVLFDNAINHICQINRILESPNGNAMLIGVGGSGKQSLSRLAAFISGLEVFQITLKKNYSLQEFKTDLASLYLKTGVRGIGSVLLLTEAHIVDEQFLVFINDHLATGEISGLFTDDEISDVIRSIRSEVRASGNFDSDENCWKFFLQKLKQKLKIVLCFSPVGSTLRKRALRFPALFNCSSICVFQSWPYEALVSVSERFLGKIEELSPGLEALNPAEVTSVSRSSDLVKSVSRFMAFAHTSVNDVSEIYKRNERRFNYTTPKSFLEQIDLFKNLIKKKTKMLNEKMERLKKGLNKIQSTSEQVEGLKEKLANQEIELKDRSEKTEKLLKNVGKQTEKVAKEKEVADEEEKKVSKIALEVLERQKLCEIELNKAEPALRAATEALNTLNKTNLTELKAFTSPPQAVANVGAAVMCLCAPRGRIPKDRSWRSFKVWMGKVESFLDSLVNFDKKNISETSLRAVQKYLSSKDFDPIKIKTKSFAASGLSAWTINTVKWYQVYCEVEPKRRLLAAANSELQAAENKLKNIQEKVEKLNKTLLKLTKGFESATNDKIKCQNEVEMTEQTIQLADRLVKGLESEQIRWCQSLKSLAIEKSSVCGDVMMTSSFISYLGYFTKPYRYKLLHELWFPFLHQQKYQIPLTKELDLVNLLVDSATIAEWNNEGLPPDQMSSENATILTNCRRWPLLVDPQLQGLKWIKRHFGNDLKVVQLGQKRYLEVIERSLAEGGKVLIENIGESIEPVLEPLLARNTIKRGRFIKIGDKECDYHPNFKLILQTKLANPHFQPEMQAQTTLINFMVTKSGLEDQLLANVVRTERPDLEKLKVKLTKKQNNFKIILKSLEDDLLTKLSAAEGNFLGSSDLVESLEKTKKTAEEIEIQVEQTLQNEIRINETREIYRPVASRGSLLYFILNNLHKINSLYKFSLKTFESIFLRSFKLTQPNDDVIERVSDLVDVTTFETFQFTRRGLFEKDKLIFTVMMAFEVMLKNGEVESSDLEMLIRKPDAEPIKSPLDFISDQIWGTVKRLSTFEEFLGLDRDIEGSSKRWKKLIDSEIPERERLPQDWKNRSEVQQLIILRSLRPDRMIYALRNFIEKKFGSKFVEGRSLDFAKTFDEMTSQTPIFFILSPGVDPLIQVESLGRKLGFSVEQGNLHIVSLGQGQEIVAEKVLKMSAEFGHWAILQNVHLVAKWLPQLEKLIDLNMTSSHRDYRIFISSEPATDPTQDIMPHGILENSIKITTEAPTGLLANLHSALDNFNQETLEKCSQEFEFKSILFSLCYFHSVVCERRKFGALGWNRIYPFNFGDLLISVDILYNYLETNVKVPWTDLRYLIGEIIYGGHITDNWDRVLCQTYLEVYLDQKQFDSELFLCPGFPSPPNLDYANYHQYIDEVLPTESPILYGLHPNAEIGILTETSENLFSSILELISRERINDSEDDVSIEEVVMMSLEEMLEKLPEEFLMNEMMMKTTERTPYILVCFQECHRMNLLIREIRRSLKELALGLNGELTISEEIESLQNSLYLDKVPSTWGKLAYPSLYGLTKWFSDLLMRCKELDNWSNDLQLPSVVWLGGLFNPKSFLTAIMQSVARRNSWRLDQMVLTIDITKKSKDEVSNRRFREGAYIEGLHLEGARWNLQNGCLIDAKLKDLSPPVLPVVFVRAVNRDEKLESSRNVYPCRLYRTRARSSTYIWTFNLTTKEEKSKWLLLSTALILNV